MAPTGRKWLQNLLFWSNQKTSYTPPPPPPPTDHSQLRTCQSGQSLLAVVNASHLSSSETPARIKEGVNSIKNLKNKNSTVFLLCFRSERSPQNSF